MTLATEISTDVEDYLLKVCQQRRAFSDKALCKRFGLSRGRLYRAIRRAKKRVAAARRAKCSATGSVLSGK